MNSIARCVPQKYEIKASLCFEVTAVVLYQDSSTALFAACGGGHYSCVELLVLAGVDVNVTNDVSGGGVCMDSCSTSPSPRLCMDAC